ncbi:MAG TPA: hypothetical protein VFU26_06895 [Gaiellaceae bacterium]|nr:hypothetical protein [Gaiellaceae bacterium]
MDEEKTPTTSDSDDVEAHGVTDRPVEDREAASDEPDVEAHGLLDRPGLDRPSQD